MWRGPAGGLELVQRCGLAIDITLDHVETELLANAQLAAMGHTLRQGAGVSFFHQPDQQPDHILTMAGCLVQPADQGDIEFHSIGRYIQQFQQARLASPEIIIGKVDTVLLDPETAEG